MFSKFLNFTFVALLFCLPHQCNCLTIPKTNLRNLSLSASDDMNEGRVVAVHLVAAKTQALYEEILKMDSLAYFSATKQLQADYPNDLEVFTWELVPGSSINDINIRLSDFRAQGLIIFARYDDSIPGLHRLVLPKKRNVRILLKRTECIISY